MALVFTEIPRHNQADVLKKLDFKSFSKFAQSATETLELMKNLKHRLPLKSWEVLLNVNGFQVKMDPFNTKKLDEIVDEPIRLKSSRVRLTRKLSQEEFTSFENVCRMMHLVADALIVERFTRNDLSILGQLMELLNVKELHIADHAASDITSMSHFPKLEKLVILSLGQMEDSDFLLFKNPNLEIDAAVVSSNGVNLYLQEWLEEKREVKNLLIETMNEQLVIADNIEVSTLWTPEIHEASLFSKFRNIKRSDEEEEELKNLSVLERDDGLKLLIASSVVGFFQAQRLRVQEFQDLEEISFISHFFC